MRKSWDTKNDNLEFVEESPTKEKICQTRCGTIRYLDKLVGEMAKSKAMEKIKRTNK